MSARTDRLLGRLWFGVAASFVLLAWLHLGTVVGARRWAAPSPALMEPIAGSAVEGCTRRLTHAQFCRHLDQD